MKKLLIIVFCIILVISFTACATIDYLMNYREADNAVDYIDGRLFIDVLDVGQGDCILVITPEGNTMLIDSGESDSYNKVYKTLDKYGVEKIDWLIATHPHSDHIGCMYKIVKKYEIGTVYMPNTSFSSYKKLMENIEKKDITIIEAESGVEIQMGENVKCEMLSPISNKLYSELNDYSPIMKIEYMNNSFLTTGDAGFENESDAISFNYDKLDSDILKIAHHGGDTATSEDFLSAVSPRYAVISVGNDNSYGHPDAKTTSLLSDKKIPIIQTMDCGDIIILMDGENITVNGCAAEDIPYEQTITDDYVYKTKNGKTYHKKRCSYLKNNYEKLTKKEAEELGLKPCSRCKP